MEAGIRGYCHRNDTILCKTFYQHSDELADYPAGVLEHGCPSSFLSAESNCLLHIQRADKASLYSLFLLIRDSKREHAVVP